MNDTVTEDYGYVYPIIYLNGYFDAETITPVSEGYIFTGYYYDDSYENAIESDFISDYDWEEYLDNNDGWIDEPIEIYAGWEPISTVDKHDSDEKQVAGHEYLGFEEIGVQKRLRYEDENGVQQYPEGLRFVTVFSDSLLTSLDAAYEIEVEEGEDPIPTPISYGYAVSAKDTFETLHGNADIELGMTKVKEVECTSGTAGRVDHQHFTDCEDPYRMFTFVITYDGADEAAKNRKIIARPYIKYKDAQGVDRVYYFDYGTPERGGTSVHKGCCASFNGVNYIYPGVRQ